MLPGQAIPRSNDEIEPCLCVVIPAYSEAASLAAVVERVLAQRPVQQVIIVDDASTDNSWNVLQRFATDPRVKLFRHAAKQGKGAALRTGFRHATAPYVIVQDADLEYDPAQYCTVLAPVLPGVADVVFGSRFNGNGAHRVLYYWHALGNKLLKGGDGPLQRFLHALQHGHPPQARIDSLDVDELETGSGSPYLDGFEIRASCGQAEPRPTIPADLAACGECLQEAFDPGQRRYRYPFTNCTNCGPRFTIIQDIPYDRPKTTMASFRMCPECHKEYENPADRRFHSQPNACPACGPKLQLTDPEGKPIPVPDPISSAIRLLKEGRVLAIKGLGRVSSGLRK